MPSRLEDGAWRATPSRGSILWLGAAAGLAGGLGEAAAVVAAGHVFHRFVFRGLDVLWMAPISLALLGTLLAIPIAVLPRQAWRAPQAGIAFFVFALLALLNAIPEIPRVAAAARLILLAGLAAAVTRRALRRSDWVFRAAPFVAGGLLALVAVLALGVRGGRWLEEKRALAALPSAPRAAPNVLFLILDTVRAMDLSLYGYDRRTSPALERLAATGIVFDRAYSPSSWTLPSHAAILTGRRPFATGVGWTIPLDATLPTLAEALRARGYATAGFSANGYYVTRESGLARGFIHFEDHPLSPTAVLFSASLVATISAPLRHALGWRASPDRKNAAQLRHDVHRWLSGDPRKRPYFAFVNYFDAHAPYLPPAPFDTAFTGHRTPWPERNPELETDGPVTPTEAAAERAVYDQTVAAQDQQIGFLLDELAADGLLDNTLVVVTSDHGEEFGEWGLLSHGNTLNPAVLWVPLVLAFPGRLEAGARVSQPISLIDLSATILSLSSPTGTSELPGFPLPGLGASRGGEAHSPAIAELEYAPDTPAWYQHGPGPLRALTLPGWHYIRETGGPEILMDIIGDPSGKRAEVSSPAAQLLLRAARGVLDSAGPAQRVR